MPFVETEIEYLPDDATGDEPYYGAMIPIYAEGDWIDADESTGKIHRYIEDVEIKVSKCEVPYNLALAYAADWFEVGGENVLIGLIYERSA